MLRFLIFICAIINCIVVVSSCAFSTTDAIESADVLVSKALRSYSNGCSVLYESQKIHISVKSNFTYVGDAVKVSKGSRIIAIAHRRNSGGNARGRRIHGTADVEVRHYNGNNWVRSQSSEHLGQTKLVDFYAPKTGLYRMEIFWTSSGQKEEAPMRARFQVTNRSCRGTDRCFGASGDNCNSFPNGSCTEEKSGLYRCDTSIGSQMHDSCCALHPGGNFCNEGPTEYCDPPIGKSAPYQCCTVEWDHAVGDTASIAHGHGKWHERQFDPLDITFKGTKIFAQTTVLNGVYTSKPLAPAYKHPKGTYLLVEDALMGWCASGSYAELDLPRLAQCR